MKSGILYINKRVYLSYQFITSYSISEKTIQDWKIKRIYIKRLAYIEYCAIPSPSRKKLPSELELRAIFQQGSKTETVHTLINELKNSITTRFTKWVNHFNQKYTILSIEKRRDSAIICCLLEQILENKGRGGVKKAFYFAYNEVSPRKYDSENAFFNALSKARKNGIESQAIDKRALREYKEDRYDQRVYSYMRLLTAHPVKYSCPQIHDQILKLCKDNGIIRVPSVEWVKKHRRNLLTGSAG